MSCAVPAMELAARGLAVFTVNPNTKAPLTRHGCLDATCDERKILEMYRRNPAAGIGVATGKPSGIVVIDVDPSSGGEDGFAELSARLGPPGSTVRVVTPRGGYHLYYRAPSHPVANSAGSLAPGVDIRGDGGYVVAPTTTRSDGTGWRWAGSAPLADPAPAWREAILAAGGVRQAGGTARQKAPAQTWVALVRDGLAEGQRNDGLARLAGHLLAKDVNAHVAVELLFAVNAARCRPPLADVEVQRIAESICGRELRRRAARGS